MNNKKGFTLIEILVVIGVIGLLTTIGLIAFNSARGKARDAKRLNDLNQIGRFLAFGCIVPIGGSGEYDLSEIISEYSLKYPQYKKYIPKNIYDPLSGNTLKTNYKYIVDDDKNCVLYTNLENENEKITLTNISIATPGGGKGVYSGDNSGENGTKVFFQISN